MRITLSSPRLTLVATTETTPAERTPAGAWLDEGETSPAWAAPVGDPSRRSRWRAPLVYGGLVLTPALVVGLLYVTGGFGRRTDLLTAVKPGAVISTGPFELSFTDATAQARVEKDGAISRWDVVAIGRARNTGNIAMAPSTFGSDSVIVLRDPADQTTAIPYGVDIGDEPGGRSDRRELTPGLPATGYRLTFRLPGDYRPGSTVRLGVADLVYEAKYLTTDEKAWDNGLYGYRIDLPVRVLPPQEQ